MGLLQRINSMFNLWYMDDGAVRGDVYTLLVDLIRMMLEEGKKIGLHRNQYHQVQAHHRR